MYCLQKPGRAGVRPRPARSCCSGSGTARGAVCVASTGARDQREEERAAPVCVRGCTRTGRARPGLSYPYRGHSTIARYQRYSCGKSAAAAAANAAAGRYVGLLQEGREVAHVSAELRARCSCARCPYDDEMRDMHVLRAADAGTCFAHCDGVQHTPVVGESLQRHHGGGALVDEVLRQLPRHGTRVPMSAGSALSASPTRTCWPPRTRERMWVRLTGCKGVGDGVQ